MQKWQLPFSLPSHAQHPVLGQQLFDQNAHGLVVVHLCLCGRRLPLRNGFSPVDQVEIVGMAGLLRLNKVANLLVELLDALDMVPNLWNCDQHQLRNQVLVGGVILSFFLVPSQFQVGESLEEVVQLGHVVHRRGSLPMFDEVEPVEQEDVGELEGVHFLDYILALGL